MLPEVGREQTPECMAHPGSTIKHWVGGGGEFVCSQRFLHFRMLFSFVVIKKHVCKLILMTLECYLELNQVPEHGCCQSAALDLKVSTVERIEWRPTCGQTLAMQDDYCFLALCMQ